MSKKKKKSPKSVNRAEFAEILAKRRDIPVVLSLHVVKTVFRSIESSLLRGGRAEIRGFGSFSVKSYKGYTGSHPKTKRPIKVHPKKRPVFRPGQLKELLKKGS